MNTPNKISLLRIILIPIFLFFYLATFIPYGKLVALAIFVIACLTDFLDGYLARKNNQITHLGTFLDSIADKLLTTTALIVLALDGTIPNPWGIIVVFITIFRDNIVNVLRQIGASNNIIIKADMFGKIKANFQFISLIYGLLLAFLYGVIESANVINILNIIFYVLTGITTIVVILSGVSYLIKNKQVFKEIDKPKTEVNETNSND